jgi:hypothetical protein
MSSSHGNISNKPADYINRYLAPAAAVAFAEGDLMYYDTSTHTVKPVSQIADQGSAAATQILAAQNFAGVNYAKHLASGVPTVNPQLLIDYEHRDFPCVSATYEVGDLLTPKYTAGANPLSDQVLTKTTNPELAIGSVIKYEGNATTKVTCRIVSRVVGSYLYRVSGGVAGSAVPPVASSVPITGGTLTPAGYSSSMIVAPAAAITGVILAAGTVDGQTVIIINNSANSITFAAAGTSNVADGTGSVIAANTAAMFVWAATPARWFRI